MRLRKLLFWTHFFIGMTVGVFIFIMAVTGAMLAFKPQIVADKTSHVRVVIKQIEGFHRWFGLQSNPTLKPIAHDLKTISTIVFLGLVVSGIYLWWPRQIKRFTSGLRGKARDWNWHNAIGFWSAPFLVIITVTGLIMCFQPKPQDEAQRQWKKLVRTIHTGEAGGLPGEIIAFAASCGATMLVWTGFAMARQRFIQLRRKENV